jgi:hypothetical protein
VDEPAAPPTDLELLAEIRDLLKVQAGAADDHGKHTA